jgi:ubiquinone/menaquinone biosynthesis C-methylase UbiE
MPKSIAPRELAAQLRCPGGQDGPEVARRMNTANGALNRHCIELLGLEPGHRVLEIGPGNGAFAGEVVGAAEGVSYVGLDWSADMVAAARRGNPDGVAQGGMHFQQGDSAQLPFAASAFDRVLSVHTLYFWERPANHLAEIRRVLRPGGRLCLAFGERRFMQDLAFTSFGFTLYEPAQVETMLAEAGFQQVAIQSRRETGSSNTGEVIDKVVSIALASN